MPLYIVKRFMNEENPINNEESKNVKATQNEGSVNDPDSPVKRKDKVSNGSTEEFANIAKQPQRPIGMSKREKYK